MLFDLKELASNNQSDESTGDKHKKLTRNFIKKHHLQAVNNIGELIGLPDLGEAHFLWSLRSFNAFSFIQFIIHERKEIDELYVTSYNMARVVIEALMHLVDQGAINYLYILLSDAAKTRFPKTYDLANLESGKRDNVQVDYKWNHSKVALAKCFDDHYVLEGSGNFADNSRHEQYLFTNDKELFEFRKTWIINDIK